MTGAPKSPCRLSAWSRKTWIESRSSLRTAELQGPSQNTGPRQVPDAWVDGFRDHGRTSHEAPGQRHELRRLVFVAIVAAACVAVGSATGEVASGQLRAFQRPARASDAGPSAFLPIFRG